MKDKSLIIILFLRVFLVLMSSYDILVRPHFSAGMKASLICGLLLLQINDYWRNSDQLYEKKRIIYYLSLIASIAGIGYYMIQLDNIAMDIYFTFPLVEIFLDRRKIHLGLLSFHVFVFLYGMYFLNVGIQSLFSYLAMLVLIYLFRSNSLEREKGQLLNAELIEANAKLKEIAIVKERTKIAQELHDSIGHALIALKMHLEFAENTIESDSQKSKEVLSKALEISKKSITDLRKAVTVLKEDTRWNINIKLQDSLTDLIESLETAGKLKIELRFDKTVEHASQDILNGIYNTVRESLTNGLKHGKATFFQIDLSVRESTIYLTVKDNGEGCDKIIKSHGLRGIEERFESLKGTVHFSSARGLGFALLAEIPFVTSLE